MLISTTLIRLPRWLLLRITRDNRDATQHLNNDRHSYDGAAPLCTAWLKELFERVTTPFAATKNTLVHIGKTTIVPHLPPLTGTTA